jgi:hypothetical protein
MATLAVFNGLCVVGVAAVFTVAFVVWLWRQIG